MQSSSCTDLNNSLSRSRTIVELLLLLWVVVHGTVGLHSERLQLQGQLWSQLLNVLVMLEIGIVGILEVQGEQPLRPRREVNVRGLRVQIVFHVIDVVVEIVIAAGELDLLLLVVFVLVVGRHHGVDRVCERRWTK